MKTGVEGFDKMEKEAESGGKPINRPKSWEEDLRLKKKELQTKTWIRKGGEYDVPPLYPIPQEGAGQKDEAERSPKQSGQNHKIQGYGEGWSNI